MHKPLRLITALCAVCILMSSCSPSHKTDGSLPTNSAEYELLDGYGRMEIAKNERYTLMVDFDDLNIFVVDNTSGKEWSTNPVDADDDPIANDDFLPRLKSQFDISYIVNRSVRNIDSYSECVEKEQYKVYSIENGVRIEYTLGDLELTVEDLPKKLSAKRAETLILGNPVLDDEQKEYFKICYEQNAESGVWEWKPNNFGSKVNDVITVFDVIGYTAQDLKNDCLEFGLEFTGTEKIGFIIPVYYTLTDIGLKIEIPSNEIRYPKDYPILDITLCPYFGAAKSDKDGYIVMPDGSGTLIEFKDTPQKVEQLTLPIYSYDQTKGIGTTSDTGNPVLMPVFGLKTGDDAFLAIVQNGDAIGKLTATRSGTKSSYNAVGASFTLCAQDSMDLSNLGTGSSEVTVLQKTPYQGMITVSYHFLSGGDADYVGMAKAYRQYLMEFMGYQKLTSSELPLYIETIGALESRKNFMGVNYQGPVPVTSYAQSLQIVEELKKEGISNIQLRLSGWLNSGYKQTPLTKFDPVTQLGSKAELRELISQTSTYLNTVFLEVQNSKNVKLSRQAAYTIDQRYARLNSSSGGVPFKDAKQNGYILSVSSLSSLCDKLIGKLTAYDGYQLSVEDLGNAVYADYKKSREVDRQKALDITVEQVKKLNQAAGKLMLASANVHTAKYADHIVEAPMTDSRYLISDKEIPFYQIVMHGLAGYAGSPLNLSSTYREDILKAAESGAGLYFIFTYEDLSAIYGMANTDLFSVQYAVWKDRCVEEYKSLNSVCGGLNDRQIVDHQFFGDYCTVTTYEGGTKIAVNHGSQAVEINGQTIPPLSYKKIS